jgi:ribulose-phosphate 3-epimerase
MKRIKVSPSMMCADFIKLGSELDILREEGADYLHVDVMDGHYVPNFTLGPDFCEKISAYSRMPLDIHLMIENPDAHVGLFARFPNAIISIHPETSRHPLRTIDVIRGFGARAGISIDPAMPLGACIEILPHVDLACVMTVNPGYAGQTLVPNTIEKIRQLAALVSEKGWNLEIEVDGNVSWANIPKMIEAGAEVLVAGSSSLFEKGGSLRDNLRRLRGMIGEAAA